MSEIIKKAGLTAAEFAKIVGVSRVTVHNWIAGRSRPHVLISTEVNGALEVLGELVKLNKLPLPPGLGREERSAKIAKLQQVIERYRA